MIFKKNLYFIAFMVLILLGPSCSNKKPDFQLNIGKVKIVIIDKKIKISNPKNTYEYVYSKESLYYLYILNNPFISLEINDSRPAENENLVDISKKANIKINNFKKFSFFSNKKSSIGFLIGSFGASGGGGANMLILDTISDDSVEINMQDWNMPQWLDISGRPPTFAEINSIFIGCHAAKYGVGERIDKILVYKKNKYREDKKLFKSICEKKYRESILSKNDIAYLTTNPFYECGGGVDDYYGRKLLDYVYYGVESGHKEEVVACVSKIDKSYKEEVDFLIEWLSKPSVSIQDRIYQFLESVLSWTSPKGRT